MSLPKKKVKKIRVSVSSQQAIAPPKPITIENRSVEDAHLDQVSVLEQPAVLKTAMRRQVTMQNIQRLHMQQDELFAEKLAKVKFRDFTSNTRMDIKNVLLKKNQVKRDRALNYWNLSIGTSLKDTSQIL